MSGLEAELRQLADAACDGALTAAERDRLEQLLRDDPAAQWLYVSYLDIHAVLTWQHRGDDPERPLAHAGSGDTGAGAGDAATPHGPQQFGAPVPAPEVPGSPTVGPSSHVMPIVWTVVGGLSGALLAVVVAIVLISRGIHTNREQPDTAQAPPIVSPLLPGEGQGEGSSPPPSALRPPPSPPVAHLSRAHACRWDSPRAPLGLGQRLFAGQALRLRAGVAEIIFDVGAKIILQGPAAFEVESDRSVRLSLGKATTQVTKLAARGFKICTPQATFTDQGTEFGVEVMPGGSSRVHVFQGCVDVAMQARGGKSPPTPERLMENAGARLEGDSSSMTLVEDTGESFIRSMDESGRNPHVLAYWRFEDRPLGMLLPDTRQNTRTVRATTDSSYNGNDLFTYAQGTGPVFCGDVPASEVPQTAVPNRGCLNTTMPPGRGRWNRDLYTRSQFSHAAPLDIQKITPARWTIEASIKPGCLGRGCQTFIGRDSIPESQFKYRQKIDGVPARLAFQITAEGRFAIRFRDVDDRGHEAVAADLAIAEQHWYHLAATSDGRVLRLYVDALDGRGYRLRAAKALPATGSTALGKGGDDCMWTIGRGVKADFPGEGFHGYIDEVRISDVALAPAQFLFAPK